MTQSNRRRILSSSYCISLSCANSIRMSGKRQKANIKETCVSTQVFKQTYVNTCALVELSPFVYTLKIKFKHFYSPIGVKSFAATTITGFGQE